MNQPLQCLLVEDDENDALLILRELRNGGYDVSWERVETAAAMQAALDRQPWDAVIADFKLPHFSGLAALELLQASGHELPFIIVSGTIGEEVAVAAMKAGAHDYLMKGRLARLVPALERELREADDRRERNLAAAALASERVLLRTVVDHLPVAVYLKDAAGRITLANPPGLHNYGLTDMAALIGKTDFDLFPPAQAAAFHADDQRVIRSGEPVRNREEKLNRPDGSEVWNLTSKVPLRNPAGEVTGLVGIALDITVRKAMDNIMRAALERTEAASRAKSEFLAIMSHELRTPLTGVLGFAELLTLSSLDEDQAFFARAITASGEHLLVIINDILDFSSFDNGVLAIYDAPLAMAKLLAGATLATRQAAAEKHLEFRCETAAGVPSRIIGDERRIRQVLANLLDNAIKFTASGSVVLRVAPVVIGDRRYLDFSVADTGIGISAATLGLLFQPFVQADSGTTRQFGGTGLGLAISKRIAEAMGGSLTVASIPGQGTAFTFRYPLGELPPLATTLAPAEVTSGALVLVVDDDLGCRTVAAAMLRALGRQAEFATDGAAAVAAFEPGKFSAILMDVAMPVMDGLEATGKIRELEASGGGHVPIIAATASVMPGDRERFLAAGMDEFLAKPFNRDGLAAVLARVEKTVGAVPDA